MGELTEIADRLYAGSLDDFTDARNAAARQCGERQLAASVKKLRKPSVAAWAVNRLVRRESEQIDSVLELAASLRAAAEALDGDELRALTRQRRQLTNALATSARSLAREAGVRLTPPVVDQVEAMLNAAMLDTVAAQVVRTGRVLTAFASTGVSELDVASVVALPDQIQVRAVPVPKAQVGATVELRVVPDNGAKLAAAEDLVEETTAQVGRAQQHLAEAESSVASLNARRLQLQGEADELRRRLATIEHDVERLDEELEEAEDARDESEAELGEVRRAHEVAERAVAKLRS